MKLGVSDRLLTVRRIFCWRMHVGIITKPRRTWKWKYPTDVWSVMSLRHQCPWDVFPIQTQSGRKWKSAEAGLLLHSFLLSLINQTHTHTHTYTLLSVCGFFVFVPYVVWGLFFVAVVWTPAFRFEILFFWLPFNISKTSTNLRKFLPWILQWSINEPSNVLRYIETFLASVSMQEPPDLTFDLLRWATLQQTDFLNRRFRNINGGLTDKGRNKRKWMSGGERWGRGAGRDSDRLRATGGLIHPSWFHMPSPLTTD